MNRKTKKIIAIGIYTALTVAGIYLALTFYWRLQSPNILTIRNNPVPVRPKEISPEATVIASPEICKSKRAEADVKRTLVSSTLLIQLPGYTNILPKGCSHPDLAVIIPGNVPDGVYHLEYTITYHLNPIKDEVDHWHTQDFVVKHDPPLPATNVSTTKPTTNITTTPTTQTTTTNDGNGNITTTTTDNATAQPPQESFMHKLFDSINKTVNKVLGRN